MGWIAAVPVRRSRGSRQVLRMEGEEERRRRGGQSRAKHLLLCTYSSETNACSVSTPLHKLKFSLSSKMQFLQQRQALQQSGKTVLLRSLSLSSTLLFCVLLFHCLFSFHPIAIGLCLFVRSFSLSQVIHAVTSLPCGCSRES